MHSQILAQYGIQSSQALIQSFGDGLINSTWKVNHHSGSYILQQVNTSVFKKPDDIDENLNRLRQFLEKNQPDYLFVSPLPALNGDSLIETESGFFRLFPFVENSHSLNALTKAEQAYEGARQFGKFSHVLENFQAESLKITLPDFHNLSLRYQQFMDALASASAERKTESALLIDFIVAQQDIVATYRTITEQQLLPLRVIHHDTKINNVLFDQNNKGLCVIDLDTVMPGYYISDVGDMMRTYLAVATEEELELDKITVRRDFFLAIYGGYMAEMGGSLTETERSYFIYAGKFLIYMQAMRFLTDHLNNDSYYGAKYPGHNLNRAANQVRLLECYLEMEPEMQSMITASNV